MNNVCDKLHVLSTVSIANADIKDMVTVYICIALNHKPLKATRWPCMIYTSGMVLFG